MSKQDYNDDKLNMFIDNQLDIEEMHSIREALLEDGGLRERVCQLKAVRELVGFAYENPPRSRWERRNDNRKNKVVWRSMAASFLMGLGVLLGWQTSEYSRDLIGAPATAASAFQFFANMAASDTKERKIILHISTDDIGSVNSALEEADNLLATYKKSNTPLKMDIVTNKTGINLLRVGVSPYLGKIESMVENYGVALYACERSIKKAEKKEGGQIVLVPQAVTNKTARDLIPERLEKGWVYIKV